MLFKVIIIFNFGRLLISLQIIPTFYKEINLNSVRFIPRNYNILAYPFSKFIFQNKTILTYRIKCSKGESRLLDFNFT